MSNFDDYFDLYDKGAYREAYVVLNDIIQNRPGISKVGNMYVWCAELELLVNNDARKARQLLDKAHELGCSDMAYYYNILGYVLWRSGEHDVGKQYLEKSVVLETSISNLKTLGRILSHDNDKDGLRIWQRILEQDPDNCMAHIYLGIEASKSGDRDKALDMVKHAERLSPKPHDLVDIGRLYYELGQFQQALNFLFEADRGGYEPKGFLYSVVAACYCSMGNYDAAVDYALRAIDLNFDDDYAKEILLSCTEEGKTNNILSGFVEKYRDTCLVSIILAQEAFKQKNSPKAYDKLSKARQLEPSPSEMYYIGRLYQFLGYLEKALDVYIQAERMGYDDRGNLYGNIACCYLHLQNFDKAIQYASKAVQIDFNNDYAKDVLLYCTEKGGTCQTLEILLEERHDTCLASIIHAQKAFRDKNLSNARKMTSNAELLDPSPAEMYNIACLCYEFSDLERSLDALLKADKLGYTYKPRLYESIAYCYYCLENYDAAIQYTIKIFAIDPDNAYAKELLYACREEVWGTEFGDNY
jgi:tetratricopeptide (TPR) repeat protein